MESFANSLLEIGVCAVPCKMPEKKPALSEWTKFQKVLPTIGQHHFNGSLGIITGKISGNLFVLDIDVKYDVSGTLLQRLETELGAELWDRIFQVGYIQKTVNNGLHIFLRCEVIEGNQKLARRHATDGELAINPTDKIRVLLETRAEGGFIVCAPTPGYEVVSGSLLEIGFISLEDKDRLFEACRSLNEVFEEVKPPTSKKFINDLQGLPPWEDFNRKVNGGDYILSQGWPYFKTVGPNQHHCRPGKKGATSGTWNDSLGLFRCFTTSTALEGDKSYTPSSLFTHLECNGDFSEAAKRLYALGYGERFKPQNEQTTKQIEGATILPKNFKDYIIKDEPTEEIGIISISGVNVLSIGNVLLLTGPMKGRKTMLASILVNQCKLKTAYIDTEQGKKHSWRTGKFTPTADVFHLRGEDLQEITRIVNACVESGEYGLMVLDNVRDLVLDFNDVKESGRIELFLKKISERVPVIAILHENKNSQSGQGHVGHGLGKIAQTSIRVQLVDVEDPAKGSYVECVRSRDEPFKRAFISMDGRLSGDDLLKIGGKTMLQEEFFRLLGDIEYSHDELTEKIADIFGIMKSSAKNSLTAIRKACPDAISERKEGKRKIYFTSLTAK